MIDPRDDVALMPGYHSPQIDVAVRLNTNEAPEPPPPAFAERLAAALADVRWHRYPDRGYGALRSRIAGLHGVEPEQVFVANGSNEVLQTLCLTYGGHGRTAAVFEPTYALHSHIARLSGTGVAVGERAEDFSLDLDEVDEVLGASEPAITFLCSPNNPTGMVDPAETVDHVLDVAPGLVVVDEAYGQFAPNSALDLVSEDRPLVVTRTYSKTWAMAAARLGYLVGPRWVVAELDVDVWPSGANFVLFRPRSRDGGAVWKDLVDRSVLVRDCSSWPRLEGCLRVTVGTVDDDDAFLDALRDVL